MKQLVVIDIGSHKFEELLVLLGPFRRQLGIYIKWALKRFIKASLTFDLAGIKGVGRQFTVIKTYFFSNRNYRLKVVSVEPNATVAQPYANKLSRRYMVHYIPAAVLGHDAEKDAELKTLFFYDRSISSSLYKKSREMNQAKNRICIGLKFEAIWDGLLKEGVIASDDTFLLRMNCEGAELGVIEACAKRRLKPLCIIGSIGDVDKIHGKRLGDKTRQLMAQMGTPYFYFKGDDPGTWYDMISVWDRYTAAYRA